MCVGGCKDYQCRDCGQPMLQEQGVCFKCGHIVFEEPHVLYVGTNSIEEIEKLKASMKPGEVVFYTPEPELITS